MWEENRQDCENGCQCSGLITENFKINSGNNSTKRKKEEASTSNFKYKMNPYSLDFKSPINSPIVTTKRRILGEISNIPSDTPKRRILGDIVNMESPRNSPLQRLKLEDRKSPLIDQSPLQRLRTDKISPLIDRNVQSPLTSRFFKRTTKISRIFEERTQFKMSNKENNSLMCNEKYVRLDLEEEARDSFDFQSHEAVADLSMTKLDFSDALSTTTTTFEEIKTLSEKDLYVPEKDLEDELDPEFETLHDLEEFEAENFDACTKYEIISTDSPNIISRGRPSTSRKVNSKDFIFGAPLADSEQSTSFNKATVSATRMLNFEDESFEFTSPAAKRSVSSFSVKKSLKFNESPIKTPTKAMTIPSKTNTPTRNPLRHERSDSSIGSMFSSPSSNLRLFNSESTTSMESGFVSEFEEPFLELEEPSSNSPKMPNFNELISGPIKENIITNKNFMKRPILQRSLSFNPEPKLKLFSIIEKESPSSGERKSQKRQDTSSENVCNKKRKSDESPVRSEELEKTRPAFQRAFSENHAMIMSALARSTTDPDLIGDFSGPYALPLVGGGQHQDLKSISADTLAALLRGDYDCSVREYKVIDCRFPYEFSGGHIPGAHNIYTPGMARALLAEAPPSPRARPAGRSVLVFHCEYSIERAPKLYRYLRSSDRSKNMEHYPRLDYPEMYLLHEGYRGFYARFPALCWAGYTSERDPKHAPLRRTHRARTEHAHKKGHPMV